MGTYFEGGEERPRSVQAFARRPRGEMSPTVRVARCWAEPPEVPQVSEPLLAETNSPAGRRQVSPLILGVGPPGLPKAREQEKPFPRGPHDAPGPPWNLWSRPPARALGASQDRRSSSSPARRTWTLRRVAHVLAAFESSRGRRSSGARGQPAAAALEPAAYPQGQVRTGVSVA